MANAAAIIQSKRVSHANISSSICGKIIKIIIFNILIADGLSSIKKIQITEVDQKIPEEINDNKI